MRCGAEISGIGLVETSIAIAVPGASSLGNGSLPIAHSSVKVFSWSCAHPVNAVSVINTIPALTTALISDCTLFTSRVCARPVICVAAVVAIVVKNLEPLLANHVLVEREARRQSRADGTWRLFRRRQLRAGVERRQGCHPVGNIKRRGARRALCLL